MACSQLIRNIKVTSELNVVVENALTLDEGYLRFGGPLVMDTEVTGNFGLFLGTGSSRLRELAIKANGQVSIQSSNGIATSGIQLDNNGLLVIDSNPAPDGLLGSENFSSNYTALNYVQKVYVDSRVVGKEISAILAAPTLAQNGFSITWDNTEQKFTLSPSGGALAGADTQVIFNSGGALVGDPQFTYSGTIMKVPHIGLGSDAVAPPGNIHLIYALSLFDNCHIEIRPKGDGEVFLGIDEGFVLIGTNTSPRTDQLIRSNGAADQVDLKLGPKGTEGVVYIGADHESGAYRYLQANGFNSDVYLMIKGKGNGAVVLDSDTSIPVYIGRPNAGTYRFIQSDSTGDSDLGISGRGIASNILIGNRTEAATDRYVKADSSLANANLHVLAKGTGLVFINGFVNYKKVSIGDWNMDSSISVSVPHGLPNHKKIVSIRVIIRDNFDATYAPLDRPAEAGGGTLEGGVSSINSTHIFLERRTGGFFDMAQYNSTGFNRGWLFISYEA